MELGTAGVPIDLALTRDYEAIFQQLSSSGISAFYPSGITAEYPHFVGHDTEADFLPPPFGTATPAIYDLARAYGISIAFSADYLFPLNQGGVDPANSPLQAILDMGGADIIHSVTGYDEAAMNGIDPEMSRAVYEHVHALDPSIKVVQVHAPVTSDDPTAYLQAVAEHGQWADVIGFNVYPISGGELGARTPLRPDEIVRPAEALGDYMTWLQTEFSHLEHIMVLQGFEVSDLYSEAALGQLDPDDLALSREPTFLELREMLIAVAEADMVFWWGPSLLDNAASELWQNILSVSALAASGNLGSPVGELTLQTIVTGGIAENATGGTFTGLRLSAVDPDGVDKISYSLDDDRFVVTADGSIHLADGVTLDFEGEPSISFQATVTSSDGSQSTTLVTVQVGDVIDLVTGTSGEDLLLGAAGADGMRGGAGNDVVNGFEGDDVIRGEDGDDLIFGEAGHDVVQGGRGADQIAGGDGNDSINGGADADVMISGAGDDWMEGGAGDDILLAEAGTTVMYGGEGDDLVFSLDGNTTISGGTGADVLGGGGGIDRFEFRAGDGLDDLLYFNPSQDVLAFEGMSRGQLTVTSYDTATVIEYAGGTLTIHDVAKGSIDADDFVFF